METAGVPSRVRLMAADGGGGGGAVEISALGSILIGGSGILANGGREMATAAVEARSVEPAGAAEGSSSTATGSHSRHPVSAPRRQSWCRLLTKS